MKHFLIIGICQIISVLAMGQKDMRPLVREGDEYFRNEQFALATTAYEEVMTAGDTSAYVSFQLAECYRRTFRYGAAEIYYQKVTYMEGRKNPLSYYYTGLMQKYNQKYDEAILSFDQFIDQVDGTSRYPDFLEQAFIEQAGARNAIEEETIDIFQADTLPDPINSPYNDFASTHLSANELLLTSGRPGRKKSYDARFGESFTDLIYVKRTDKGWESDAVPVRVLNDKYNDGSGRYSPRKSTLLYTICGNEGPECMIYQAKLDTTGQWTEPVALNKLINRPGYDAKQPALSMTGDTLFFVSNRPGGKGGTDIWMSIGHQGDDWGPPVNLGPSVNTHFNEVSPATTPLSHVLLFASNGHQGYGGYDLFMARKLSSGDTSLINIGIPFNSSRDELYPELYEDSFYWSSNREGGRGQFDIYSSQTGEALKFISRLSVLKKNSAKRADVVLTSRRLHAEQRDLFTLILEDKLEYEQLSEVEKGAVDKLIQGESPDVVLNKFSAGIQNGLMRLAERRKNLLASSRQVYNTFELPDSIGVDSYTIEGRISIDSASMLEKVYLINEEGEVIMISGVSDKGGFKFSNIPGGQRVRLESDPVPDSLRQDVQVSDVKLLTVKTEEIKLENIYFDLDRYTLRPEARVFLDDLARILSEHPSAQVEIYAYADNQGSPAYNLILTKNRGQYVYNYFVEKGVSPDQLLINPRGSEFPEEREFSEIQRQLSRRVEFKVHHFKAPAPLLKRTCFTSQSIQKRELLQRLALTDDQLYELNGEVGASLRAYQPIRIPENLNIGELVVCPD
jgi:outer membrane protein OmpA-like peptidoglycan-associated protein